MSNQPGGAQGISYYRSNNNNAPNVWYFPRDPNQYDNQGYALLDLAQNTVTGTVWQLISLDGTSNSGGALANWVMINSSGGDVLTLSGNIGTNPVFPIAGNINVFGDGVGINISGDGVNTLTASLVGDGIAAQTFITNPATGTAVPDSSGELTFAGAGGITASASGNTVTLTGSGGGSGITTIDGDTGSITGSTVTIYANNATQNAGSTVAFINSGTVSTLNVSDMNNNTLIGLSCGGSAYNTIAGANTGLGYQTFYSLTGSTSAASNVAMGYQSMFSATTGSQNTSIGNSSLYALLSSNNNVALGASSLTALVSGTGGNTAVGANTLTNITTGSFNVAIGSSSGASYGSTETGNITINTGGTEVTGENYTLRIGSSTGGAGNGTVNAAFICGISGNPSSITDADQVVCIDATDQLTGIAAGTSGQVLTSNGAGALPSWQTVPSGTGALIKIQSQTASSATSVAFTTGITSAYNNYLLLIDSLNCSTTSSGSFVVQLSTNGGSSFISSGYKTTTTGLLLFPFNDATLFFSDAYNLMNLTSGSGYVAGIGTYVSYDNSSGGTASNPAGGVYTTTGTTINAFQVIIDGTNTFSGTFTLYGYVL